MTNKLKFLPLVIVLVLFTSISSWAINADIPRINSIPVGAQRIACGCGWTVYSQKNNDSSSILYLEDNQTDIRYELLRTKGKGNAATRINIKAKNSYAYGTDVYRQKSTATYEYGYILTVDEVFMLSHNKILLSGALNSQITFNYVLDLDKYSAVHIPAYENFIQMVAKNGKRYLEFNTYEYSDSERNSFVKYRALFNIEGQFISRRRRGETYQGDHNLVFYMWDRGDLNGVGQESKFGHSFVHIPGLGYVGYGGTVAEDSKSREYATDSCCIYISSEQLQAVYDEYRRWQKFTPDYMLMRHDCTSFVLDIADAAGIEYGTRIEVQWPSYFMKKLKKYHPNTNDPLVYVSSGRVYKIQEIPYGVDKLAEGYGWSVYKLDTEDAYGLYKAAIIFLKKDFTGDSYVLLATKGEKQEGTQISIKAQTSLAYGMEDTHYKSAPTYEYGCIQAIDEAYVLSPDKILFSGVPDSRNNYNYVLDLNTYTAVHIPAYENFIQTVVQDGKKYLGFYTYGYHDYEGGGRVRYKVLYDMDGNLIGKVECDY